MIRRQPGTAQQHPQEIVFVDAIAVLPAYQRQGIGRAVLDALRSAASELGIDVLSLHVWIFNEGARAFFRRCGFTVYNEQLWNR